LLGSKAAPDFLVLPKTETAGHLQILDRLLTSAGKDTRLIGLIESTRPRQRGSDARDPRLAGLMPGAADLAADRAATAWQPLALARGRFAACACWRTPIDLPFSTCTTSPASSRRSPRR
jgi:(S)-citramalyl-CoA lyase